jgi:hypothetical protein
VLALSGCGLESFIVLEPPVAAIASGTDTFSFRATIANSEPEFLGFEVYYRIYAVSGDAYPTYFNTFDNMLAGSFQRLYDPKWAPGAPGFSRPLIAPDPVDHGADYKITIDFNVPQDLSYPQVSSLGLTLEIMILAARRAVAGVLEYKRLKKSAFGSGEADMTALAYTSIFNSEDVRIVMFAVSYGFDTSNFTQVYSLPVLIGIEDLTIRDFSD